MQKKVKRMNWRTYKGICALIMVGVFLLTMFPAQNAMAYGEELELMMNKTSMKAGETVTASVLISGDFRSNTSAKFAVHYDATLFAVEPNSFDYPGMYNGTINTSTNGVNGIVNVSSSSLRSYSGNTKLFNITFRALSGVSGTGSFFIDESNTLVGSSTPDTNNQVVSVRIEGTTQQTATTQSTGVTPAEDGPYTLTAGLPAGVTENEGEITGNYIVTGSPSVTIDLSGGTAQIPAGASVTLTATPANGFLFDKWASSDISPSGSEDWTKNTLRFNMTKDIAVTGAFVSAWADPILSTDDDGGSLSSLEVVTYVYVDDTKPHEGLTYFLINPSPEEGNATWTDIEIKVEGKDGASFAELSYPMYPDVDKLKSASLGPGDYVEMLLKPVDSLFDRESEHDVSLVVTGTASNDPTRTFSLDIPLKIIVELRKLTYNTDFEIEGSAGAVLTFSVSEDLGVRDAFHTIEGTHPENSGFYALASPSKADTYNLIKDIQYDNSTATVTVTMADTIAEEDYNQYASVLLTFTPSAGYIYEKLEISVPVRAIHPPVGGYSAKLQSTPNRVTLGEDIDLGDAHFYVQFDETLGLPPFKVYITRDDITGYDKDATGEGSIGSMEISVTKVHNGITYTGTFMIYVEDVVTSIAFGTKPSGEQVDYQWLLDNELNLEGITIIPTMKSAIPHDPVAVTTLMIDPGNEVLMKMGTHEITVTYEGQIVTYSIEVEEADSFVMGEPTRRDELGIIDYAEAEFPEGITEEEIDEIEVTIETISQSVGENLIESMPDFLRELIERMDEHIFMRIIMEGGGEENQDLLIGGHVDLQIPYPAGTDMDDTFVAAMRAQNAYAKPNKEGRSEPDADGVISVVKAEEGLVIEVTSEMLGEEMVIGWDAGGMTGLEVLDTEQRALEFWETVEDRIDDANRNSYLRVNARSYDQMPVDVMVALEQSDDVTVIIDWDGGGEIIITSDTALHAERDREYYPLSMLEELFGTDPPKTDDPAEQEEWEDRMDALNGASSGDLQTLEAPYFADDITGLFTPPDAGISTASEATGTSLPTVPSVPAVAGAPFPPINVPVPAYTTNAPPALPEYVIYALGGVMLVLLGSLVLAVVKLRKS